MKTILKMIAYFMIIFSVGCASSPKQIMERDIRAINEAYNKDDKGRYYYLLNSAVSDAINHYKVDSEPSRDLKVFLSDPKKTEKYKTAFQDEYKYLSNLDQYKLIINNIENFEKLGIFTTRDLIGMKKDVKSWIYNDNLSLESRLNINYEDNISKELFLSDDPSQTAILKRSIDVIQRDSSLISLDGYKNLAENIQLLKSSNPAEYEKLSATILNSTNTLSLARALDPFYPGTLDSFDARTKLKVAVEIKGVDRITALDLLTQLKNRVPEIEWMEQGLKEKNRIFPELVVERARWSESDLPNSNNTVTLDRTSVDFTNALLFMPDLSTYNYEVQTRGFSIDYGFLIVYKESAKSTGTEKVVRGMRDSKSTTCANQRITNAFGGIKAADFTANSEMRSICGKMGASKETIRAEIISELQVEITSFDRLKETIKLRQ